jgi:hypothetical protein
MDKKEIEVKVKEVISLNSRYSIEEINPSDPLDKFITSFMADRLARELKRKFDKIETTKMTNDLYSILKKVSDVIDRINSIYNK